MLFTIVYEIYVFNIYPFTNIVFYRYDGTKNQKMMNEKIRISIFLERWNFCGRNVEQKKINTKQGIIKHILQKKKMDDALTNNFFISLRMFYCWKIAICYIRCHLHIYTIESKIQFVKNIYEKYRKVRKKRNYSYAIDI